MSASKKIDLVVAEMRARVNKLRLESDISSYERNQMGLLATRLSENLPYGENQDVARLEWLLIFMEGDVDWKDKYEEVFGQKLPKPPVRSLEKPMTSRYWARSEMA